MAHKPSDRDTARMAQQALLVVDMQQAFDVESRWGRRNNPDCEANVVGLIEASQRRGEPVVFVRHDSVEADSLLRPSEPGNRFKPELEHIEPDLLVSKSVHSSFHGEPDLDRWLRSRGIDSVVICGIATDHCCETTARLASDLGYRVSFPLDATLTFDRQDLQGQTITADEIARVTAASLAGEFAEITTTAALLAGQSRPS
jgi:nicotinamidase-related amidase